MARPQRPAEQQAILDAFGSYLRALRKKRKWTQQALGERAGLSGKYVGGIERGERNLAVINLNRLAVALEENFAGFFPFRQD